MDHILGGLLILSIYCTSLYAQDLSSKGVDSGKSSIDVVGIDAVGIKAPLAKALDDSTRDTVKTAINDRARAETVSDSVRSGKIRVGFYLAPRGIWEHTPGKDDTSDVQFWDKKYGNQMPPYLTHDTSSSSFDYIEQISSVRNSQWIYPYVQGSFRVRRFLSIDVGLQVGIGHVEYKDVWIRDKSVVWDITDSSAGAGSIKYSFVAPGITFGVNFTKTFYPFKINTGSFIDIFVPLSQRVITWDSTIEQDSHFGCGLGIGIGHRLGCELFLSPQASITLDTRLRFALCGVHYSGLLFENGYASNVFTLQPLQLALGMVFYW